MKHFFKTPLILLATVFLLWSCSDDDDNNGGGEDSTVVDLALGTADLSSLVAALNQADAGLVETLSGPGPFTVFAPTNAAFTNLLASLDDFSSLEDFDTAEERALLASILTYHVVAAEAFSGDLSDGQTLTTVNGSTLTVSLSGGVFIQDATDTDAEVTGPDVDASNGVVHIINKVLLPQAVIDAINDPIEIPSIVEIATGNGDFSSLVAALTAADLVDTLNGDGPFTVFAPTNNAFAAFLDANGFASLDEVPVDVLTQVLLNHVVSGTNLSTDLSTGYISSLSTAGPGDTNLSLFVNRTSDGVIINGLATVTGADNIASNGVVHIVDEVIELPTVVTFAIADATFAPLVTALTTGTPETDFVTVLDGDGPFTVFAPTDTAFQALLDSNMDWNEVTDIEEGLLTSVLNHHVVSGNIRSGDLTNPGDTTAPTLEGDNITITLPGTGDNIGDITDGSGAMDIGIIAVDVQASNGVIHVISKVMIPNTGN